MKCLSTLLLSVICLLGLPAQSNKIILGVQDSMHSTILNEQRKLWIYTPASYDQQAYRKSNYPVIYLLDGEYNFHLISGLVHHLSNLIVNPPCPEMMVVAIHNTNRDRDLAPYPPGQPSDTNDGYRFLKFLEQELVQYIDSTYRTQPYRILIGRSLGGLCVVNAMAHRGNVFNSFVAVDPSLWWDHRRFLPQAQKSMQEKKFEGKKLFLAMANTMPAGLDTLTVQQDTSLSTEHIRSILQFKHFLEAHPIINTGLKYYDQENHSSVLVVAAHDALRFIFRDYQISRTNSDYQDTSFSMAGKYENHYRKVSDLYGIELKPSEADLNGLGLHFLSVKQYRKAADLFNLNTRYYPESASAHAHYASCLEAMGDREQAIVQYQKSLAIRDDPETRKKLEFIGQKRF